MPCYPWPEESRRSCANFRQDRLQTEEHARDKDSHYVMTKGSILQGP